MTKQKPAAKKTGYVVEERTSQGWVKHNVVYQTKKEAQEFIGTDHGKMRVVKHVQKKNKSVYPVEEKRIDKKGKPGNPEDDVVDYTQQVRRRPFKKGGEAGYVRVGESEKKGYIVKVTAVGKGLPPRAAGKQKGEKKPKPAAKPPSVKGVIPAEKKVKPTKQPKAEPAPGKAPKITYGEFKAGYLSNAQQEMVEKRLAKLDVNKLTVLLTGLATKRGWVIRFKQHLNIDLGEKKPKTAEKPAATEKPKAKPAPKPVAEEATTPAAKKPEKKDLEELSAYVAGLGEELNEAAKPKGAHRG